MVMDAENGNDRDLMFELQEAAAWAQIRKIAFESLLSSAANHAKLSAIGRKLSKGAQNDDIRNQGKGQGILRIGGQLV